VREVPLPRRLGVVFDHPIAAPGARPATIWDAFVATSTAPPGGITFRTKKLHELFTITRDDMTGGSRDVPDGQFGVSSRWCVGRGR